MSSTRRTFVRILIVTFVTALIFFILGEMYLRNFSNYGIEHFTQLNPSNNKVINNNELNFINVHVVNTLQKTEQDTKDTIYQKQLLYRIMVLGDSIANAGELKKGERGFPAILREILQKDYPEINFEVLVFAEGGYSTAQEIAGYEKYGKPLMPDLVILAYCHNDTAEANQKIIKRNGHYLVAFYKTDIPYLNKIPFNRFFTERFLITRITNESLIKFLYHYHILIDIKFCLLTDQKIYQAFLKLYLLTKNTNTPVLVVVFPYLEETVDISRDRMSQLIKKWCAEFDFLHVDLQETYKKYDYRKLQCNRKDPVHPNALGHRLASELIAEKIEQNIFKGED